ncbi:MAG: hypothetical protein KY475_10250 [Planctomycetes bacterium]|nr:hypothetical protein [Planctomycetota bacterium]
MTSNDSTSDASATLGWLRFRLRELFLIVLAAALAVGWYSNSLRRGSDGGTPKPVAAGHVAGPLLVNYRVQYGNTTFSHREIPAASLDFHETYVVVTYASGRGRIIPVSSLRSFEWRPAPAERDSSPSSSSHRH